MLNMRMSVKVSETTLKPEELLKIILSTTNKGDLVADHSSFDVELQ